MSLLQIMHFAQTTHYKISSIWHKTPEFVFNSISLDTWFVKVYIFLLFFAAYSISFPSGKSKKRVSNVTSISTRKHVSACPRLETLRSTRAGLPPHWHGNAWFVSSRRVGRPFGCFCCFWFWRAFSCEWLCYSRDWAQCRIALGAKKKSLHKCLPDRLLLSFVKAHFLETQLAWICPARKQLSGEELLIQSQNVRFLSVFERFKIDETI